MDPSADVQTPKPMSVIGRVVNLFVSPAETFESLAAKPDWFTPLCFTILFFLVSGVLLKDVILKEQEKAVRKAIMTSTEIADSQKEETADQQLGLVRKFWFVGLIVGGVVMVGMFFVGGLFLLLAGNQFLGGQASYLHVLSVLGYSRLIESIGTAVKLPAMVTKATLRVDTGLGFLVPRAEITSVPYTLLSKVDMFTMWQLGVLILGVSMVYRTSKTRSAILVLVLWVVWVLVQTGLAAIGVRFG